jgi:hypothetical protein
MGHWPWSTRFVSKIVYCKVWDSWIRQSSLAGTVRKVRSHPAQYQRFVQIALIRACSWRDTILAFKGHHLTLHTFRKSLSNSATCRQQPNGPVKAFNVLPFFRCCQLYGALRDRNCFQCL